MIRFTVKSNSIPMSVSSVGNAVSMKVEGVSINYSSGDPYMGEYEVMPSPTSQQTLKTAQKLMSNDVIVHKIPYYETSNNSGGNTVYIGIEV